MTGSQADVHVAFLLWSAIAAVLLLIALIVWARLNPFLTLTVCSLGLAVAAGIPLPKVVASFEAGVGGTLGHVAVVVALGTMLGKMLAESGAARHIAGNAGGCLRRKACVVGHAVCGHPGRHSRVF